MARSLNKVMLIGNLGADPELRYTPNGVPVATFRIATTETWRDPDGKPQERTEWHTVVVWRKLAELTNELLKKGSKVYVEGRIQTRTYEDRNGIRRTVTEIVADDIILLEPKTTSAETLAQIQQKTMLEEKPELDTEFNTEIDIENTSLPEQPHKPESNSTSEEDDLPF